MCVNTSSINLQSQVRGLFPVSINIKLSQFRIRHLNSQNAKCSCLVHMIRSRSTVQYVFYITLPLYNIVQYVFYITLPLYNIVQYVFYITLPLYNIVQYVFYITLPFPSSVQLSFLIITLYHLTSFLLLLSSYYFLKFKGLQLEFQVTLHLQVGMIDSQR